MKKYLVLTLLTTLSFHSFCNDPSISASIVPNNVQIGTKNIFVLTFDVDSETISPGTIIEILTFSGLDDLSFINASATASNGAGISDFGLQTVQVASTFSHPIWDDDKEKLIIRFTINSAIPTGESITVNLGSSFQKTKMHNYATIDDFKVLFKKPDNTYFGINNVLQVTSNSFPAEYVRVFIPSIVKTNDTIDLIRISIIDKFENRQLSFSGNLEINCGPTSSIQNTSVQMTGANQGYLNLPLSFNEEGFCQCEVKVISSNSNLIPDNTTYKSNFAWVKDNPEYRIYWGDLHSHSSISPDGSGGRLSFEYAKYAAGLDFFAAAEHNHTLGNDWSGINDEEWDFLKQQTTDFYEQGKFVPILAYENNYTGPNGGHHNAYFDWDETESIASIVRHPTNMAPNVLDLFSLLDNYSPAIKVLCFPHFLYSGNITQQDQINPPFETFGPIYANEKYRRLYEMYSSHGQSEYYNPDHGLNYRLTYWYAQDALAKGEKLGFIGATDNHIAKPGNNGQGLGAVIAGDLNRNALFESLDNRLTYASVGERIIIEFNEQNNPMGSDVQIEQGAIPVFNFLVHGTGPLDKVELVKWDFVNGIHNGVRPVFNTILAYNNLGDSTLKVTATFADDGFVANSVYYLRVKQKQDISSVLRTWESWAWSSPIWVSDTSILTSIDNQTIHTSKLRPNPIVVGQSLLLDIQSNLFYPNARIVVFDYLGQEFYRINKEIHLNEQTIEIPTAGMPCGSYFVSIINDDKRLLTKPFIITHN